VSAVQTDLTLVNRLHDAHRFRWVGEELHITDREGWEINEHLVDRSRPITMGASGATLPTIRLREFGRVDHFLDSPSSTPISCAHALLYAATFGMRIFTNTSGDFTVEGPTL